MARDGSVSFGSGSGGVEGQNTNSLAGESDINLQTSGSSDAPAVPLGDKMATCVQCMWLSAGSVVLWNCKSPSVGHCWIQEK
mmetsp:Transcript_14678/g.28928  ORF Transcript_14678/g.28928 Transcript_14678/m.28928 type:complete len:82 (-) Transcript_14678:1415-1660(-)